MKIIEVITQDDSFVILIVYSIKVNRLLILKQIYSLSMWQRPTFPLPKGAVLSAMRGLTSRFEMELGITLSLAPPQREANTPQYACFSLIEPQRDT